MSYVFDGCLVCDQGTVKSPEDGRPLPCPECSPRVGDLVFSWDREYLIEHVQSGPGHVIGFCVVSVGESPVHTFIGLWGNIEIRKRREELVAERLMA